MVLCVSLSYQRDVAYARDVVVTTAEPPTFTQRAPFQVASAQARPSLGEHPGDLVDVTYLPDEDAYTGLVERRGMLTGYDAVLEQAVPLTGRAAGHTCGFAEAAGRRLDGLFGANLGRLINSVRRGVSWDEDDAYGYCARDSDRPGEPGHSHPVVVVPLVEQDGLFVVTKRPAGVAVYDGRTGKLEIREDPKGIPGPTYPLSMAARQRAATNATGDFRDWFFKRVGWETSEGADDTNSGNNAEFVLADAMSGQTLYVTPLTGRGSATAISAISTLEVGSARGGGYATLRVYRLRDPWVSPSAIVSRLKADYQDVPNWQNIKVMEISPLSGNRWVATLGNDQNLLYRAHGVGDLVGPDPDAPGHDDPARQSTCLLRADGTVIRCGTLADTGGRGVGTQFGSGEGTGTAPGDLTSLPDAELAELGKRVAAEAARRLTGREPG